MKKEIKVEIKDKLNLTIEEAAAYSNIGINKINEIAKRPNCPFVLYIGRKKLIKRREFEKYLEKVVELRYRLMSLYMVIYKYCIKALFFSEERRFSMGKDLKGKELGVGISQRKDGLYTARFTDRNGKRRQQYFKKLQECRNWLADAQFEDVHGGINASGDMTVTAWFKYWIENVKGAGIKYNTMINYNSRFKYNIEPFIGKMLLAEVKPLHCQNVLNQMASSGHKNSSIKLTRTTMHLLFDDAVENELIQKNPVTKAVKCIQGGESLTRNAITKEDQVLFMNAIRKSGYYSQFALVLQTGLRVGELTGLKWSDIDFENKCINICRTMTYRDKEWRESTPKSKSGFREVPLTEEALKILKDVKAKKVKSDIIPLQYRDIVFLSANGIPILPTTYNNALRPICRRIGIPQISMHILRHTFATRCIEAGMQPKTLQEILGHASIEMTMDIYVHVMKDTKLKEMSEIESALKII